VNSGRYDFFLKKHKKRFDTELIFMHYTPVFPRDGLSLTGKFFFDL